MSFDEARKLCYKNECNNYKSWVNKKSWIYFHPNREMQSTTAEKQLAETYI